jgi:Cu(I)/Ag(I) efflux system periplasmic protein CusF
MSYQVKLAVLGAFVILAGCGESAVTSVAAEAAQPAGHATPIPSTAPGDAPHMTATGVTKSVKATGRVTATDAAAGTITVSHNPIPEAGWPAMTMVLKASPGLAQTVKAGDRIAFDLDIKNGEGEITGLSKQ